MRVTAYSLVLFFVCLNLSLFLLNNTQVLPDYRVSPFEEPEGIQAHLISFDISGSTLLMAGTALSVWVIISALTGNLIFGGTVALILFALTMLFPVVRWILYGFPIFLQQVGVPTVIVTVIEALMAVVWFWFILGFVGQRSQWEQ